MSSVRLETQGLSFAPFTKGDVDRLHELWTKPSVRKFLWDDQIITRETVIEVVEASLAGFDQNGFGFWTVSFKGDHKLIGFCGRRYFQISPGTDDEVEILYGLLPAHWGQGLATEASLAVLRYGFENAGLKQIYAGADPPNEASFRVMKRLGMRFARRITINEMPADYYVIVRDEFQPGKFEFQGVHKPPG